jgi:hypothetical protein
LALVVLVVLAQLVLAAAVSLKGAGIPGLGLRIIRAAGDQIRDKTVARLPPSACGSGSFIALVQAERETSVPLVLPQTRAFVAVAAVVAAAAYPRLTRRSRAVLAARAKLTQLRCLTTRSISALAGRWGRVAVVLLVRRQVTAALEPSQDQAAVVGEVTQAA